MIEVMTNQIASTAPVPQPIRVGALAPLSRPGCLEAGQHLAAGIELAVDEINAAGGIGGRPIELLLRDTAGVPERAVDAVREFAARDAVAIVGEYHSIVAYAAAGEAVKTRLPFVCSSAVLDAVVDTPTDLVARVAPAQSYCWSVYADYLVSARYRHVALVIEPNRYWSAGARLLRTFLPERGARVTELDYASLEPASIADALVAAGGVDVLLLLVGYPEPAVSLVKAVRADPHLAGLRIGDPAGRAESPQWWALLGEDGADVPFLRYLPARLGPLGTRVAEQVAAQLGEPASFVAFEGYDSVQVIAEAMRVGGPDRRRISEVLTSIKVAGTRGTMSFARGSGADLQWTWPPVQVASRRDPRRPERISVLFDDGVR